MSTQQQVTGEGLPELTPDEVAAITNVPPVKAPGNSVSYGKIGRATTWTHETEARLTDVLKPAFLGRLAGSVARVGDKVELRCRTARPDDMVYVEGLIVRLDEPAQETEWRPLPHYRPEVQRVLAMEQIELEAERAAAILAARRAKRDRTLAEARLRVQREEAAARAAEDQAAMERRMEELRRERAAAAARDQAQVYDDFNDDEEVVVGDPPQPTMATDEAPPKAATGKRGGGRRP